MKPYDSALVQEYRNAMEEMGLGVIIWSIEDVQAVAPNLTDDQAMIVLKDAIRHMDANEGVNWETLRFYVTQHFGSAHIVDEDDRETYELVDSDGVRHTVVAESYEQAEEIARLMKIYDVKEIHKQAD